MRTLVVVFCGFVGLAVGSFLSVVVHRVPDRLSIVRPRSHCPVCGHELHALDCIPIVSFARFRGRCRNCASQISLSYLLLEIASALLFCAVAARISSFSELPAYLVFTAALIALAAIDLQRFRLPTSIIWVTAFIGLPLLVLASAATHAWGAWVNAAVAGVAGFFLFFVVFIASRGAIGFGDVRLAGLCGLFLGWLGPRIALSGFLVASILGGVVGLIGLATRRLGPKSRLPFGPFLAAGAMVAVLFGGDISRIWLG